MRSHRRAASFPVVRSVRFALIALLVTIIGASIADSRAVGAGKTTGAAAFSQPHIAVERADRQTPPQRSATIISDSAMAGVRWNGALGGFRGFDADDRLQSCRRLVARSCFGREGIRPPTALEEIRSMPMAAPSDVLVIAVGYNDVPDGFNWQSRVVLDAARAKGFATVAWVTYRELVGYTLPRDSVVRRSNYASMNTQLRAIVASGDYPELRLWDLDGYTRGVAGWFTSDGVHELRRGSWGVADWISRHMAALDGRPCPMPWTPTFAQDQMCPNPDPLAYVRGWPDLFGLYGV